MAERRLQVGNLPADLTSFVGRGEELSQVRRLLSQSRLVTLTGVGGVGKSRLALRLAQRLSRVFPDGVWLVELSSLQDAVVLPQAVGEALGIPDRATGDPVQALSEALAQRKLLVVLDNCEHLVPACRLLLAPLLRATPGLRVLATSREVLRIPGEQVCEVTPLQVPRPSKRPVSPDAVASYPGVALFARRAGEVQPHFSVTADNADAVLQVCELSEGLPLFIELAAAKLRWLSPAQLADRLHDRFKLLATRTSAVLPRHQTLRAAVEWSFTLCTDAERLMWMRASAFAGRFDLEAAEGVCAGDGLVMDELLDALAGLIDKSVLVSAERDGVRRYWMLDTLRAYGLERLRKPDLDDGNVVAEAELRRRHRDYYLRLAERFNADWFGPRQVAWSRRMHAELPELRAALAFCLATPGEEPVAVRLAGMLGFFWWGCGATREGRLWLERALAADPFPGRDRVRAMIVYVRVLVSTGLHVEAAQPARECLELARRLDDPALLADALSGLGLSLTPTDDVAAALPVLDEAIELAAALPDTPVALAMATLYQSIAALADGDPVRADALATRSRDVCRAHGDRWRLNHALSVSMQAALKLGDVARATAYGRESVRGHADLGDTNGLSQTLEILAWTAAADGDHWRAARLLGVADRQARALVARPFAARRVFRAGHEQCEATARAALGDVRFDAEFRAGAELTLDDAIAYARGDETPQATPRARTVPRRADLPPLTKREHEVALLIAEGLTNKQIAHQLVIAQRTAESHVEHILTKLGVTTRTQIASWVFGTNGAAGPGNGRRLP